MITKKANILDKLLYRKYQFNFDNIKMSFGDFWCKEKVYLPDKDNVNKSLICLGPHLQ